jgi:hypothetical protein
MVIIETFAAGCVPRHRPTVRQLAIRIDGTFLVLRPRENPLKRTLQKCLFCLRNCATLAPL